MYTYIRVRRVGEREREGARRLLLTSHRCINRELAGRARERMRVSEREGGVGGKRARKRERERAQVKESPIASDFPTGLADRSSSRELARAWRACAAEWRPSFLARSCSLSRCLSFPLFLSRSCTSERAKLARVISAALAREPTTMIPKLLANFFVRGGQQDEGFMYDR